MPAHPEAAPPVLRLELLGSVQVWLGNKPLKLGVKPILMLSIAALRGKLTRRELGTMLWKDSSNPLNNLSVALNALEKTLGKGILETDLEFFALASGFSCDVLEFRAGLATEQVWDLWRGAFLTGLRLTSWEMGLGDEFDEWLFSTREALMLERRELAARLGATQLRLGQFETAIEFLKISQNPDGEPLEAAARHLMLAYGALQQADQASVVFLNLKKLLLEELGVEPSQQTLDALQAVRTKPDDCRALLALELGSSPPKTVAAANNTQLAPLIGREAELQEMRVYLERNAAVCVVAILGEPGAGKSRLAREWLGNEPAAWLTFSPINQHLGFLEMLVRYCLKEHPNAIRSLPKTQQRVLFRWLDATLEQSEPMVLFHAARALVAVCDLGVLVLDDAQWMDQPSLDFLLFLVERPMAHLFRVVLTKRNTETASSQLDNALQALKAKLIVLKPLSMTAIEQLNRYFGETSDPQTLQKRSGGNAFFVLEMLRFSGSQEAQNMVQARLQHLSPEAYQLLEVLCIRGAVAGLLELKSIAGRSLEELNTALETLLAAQLIQPRDVGFAFVHDIIRETVEQNISFSRRNLLHLRAAQLGDQQAARHYWEAKSIWEGADSQAAYSAFLEYSRLQSLRGDLAAAKVWLERSLSVAQTPQQRAAVFLRLAQTLERFGQHQEALEELETAESMAALLEPILRAEILNAKVWILQRDYRDFSQSTALTEAALGLLLPLNTSSAQGVMGQTYHLLGSYEYNQKNYDLALEHYQKAARIQRGLGNMENLADSLGGLGIAYAALENNKAKKYLLECLTLREQLGDVYGISRALTNLAMCYGNNKQPLEALEFQKQSLKLQQSLENPIGIAIALNNVGALYFRLEQFQEARTHYEKAISTMLENNLPVRQSMYDNLAEVKAALMESV